MPMDLRTTKPGKNERIENYFQEPEIEKAESDEPHNITPEEYAGDVLFHWQAPEFEKSQWDKRWYLIAVLILAAIIVYALVSNSPIMAITFILIGIVGYIYLQKEPRILDFMITHEGIVAGNEIYEFKHVGSFWIFYEHHIKVLSLHMKGKLLPFTHIPVHEEDPVKIREILLQFIPEVEQEPSLVDNIERLLRI